MTRSTQSRFSWGKHRSRVRPPASDETTQARRNLRSAQAHHDTTTKRSRKITLPRVPWDEKEEKS